MNNNNEILVVEIPHQGRAKVYVCDYDLWIEDSVEEILMLGEGVDHLFDGRVWCEEREEYLTEGELNHELVEEAAFNDLSSGTIYRDNTIERLITEAHLYFKNSNTHGASSVRVELFRVARCHLSDEDFVTLFGEEKSY